MGISLELLHSNVFPHMNRREFCSFERLPEPNLTKIQIPIYPAGIYFV